jgi:hypothetical protein
VSGSRQLAEASDDGAEIAARFTLEVFALKIVRTTELLTISPLSSPSAAAQENA